VIEMQEQTKVQENLRLWLLGLLSQEQSESLEQRLITDNRVFEEISIVEDELIDEYLSDELSERERGAFESFFMNSSERQQQFKVGKAWRSYIEREDPFGRRQSDSKFQNLPSFAKQQPSFLASLGAYRIPLTATLLILVAGIVWVAFRSRSTPPGRSQAFVLEPAIQTREGGSLAQIVVPRDTQIVELHAKLPKGDSKSYRATLSDADANNILTIDKPTVDTSRSEIDVVVVPVPTQRLKSGQYKLQLDILSPDGRTENAASYRFVIVTS
jgi:hypothetical protein